MKWFLYLVATGLISLASYQAYVRIDTGFEGIVGWITATIAGGWFLVYVGNLFYRKQNEKNSAPPAAAGADSEKPQKSARANQSFI
jgi:hypothetical protein